MIGRQKKIGIPTKKYARTQLHEFPSELEMYRKATYYAAMEYLNRTKQNV